MNPLGPAYWIFKNNKGEVNTMLLHTNDKKEEDTENLGATNKNNSEGISNNNFSHVDASDLVSTQGLTKEELTNKASLNTTDLSTNFIEITENHKQSENNFRDDEEKDVLSKNTEISVNTKNTHFIQLEADFSNEIADAKDSDKNELLIENIVSNNFQHLLSQLGLTKNDLTHAGINLTFLEYALNPGIYGKIIHFIMTTPILLSILRWPLLQRSAIVVPEEELPKKHISLLMSAEEGNYASDLDIQQNPRENTLPLAEDSPLVNNSHQEKKTKGRGIIFTTRGLLLGTHVRLRIVLTMNAFYTTAIDAFISLWSALVASLIIQGTFNFYYYPDERGDSTLWDAFGFSTLLNIICIKSLNNLFCVHEEREYAIALASALNEIYIWPFILGIPLLLGIVNGSHALYQTRLLETKKIESFLNDLRLYEPGVFIDTLGWIFTLIIPELFAGILPEAIIFSFLPQPRIRVALEKIRNHIIWDGRLDNEERQNLFEELVKFSKQRTRLTQLKALAMLADIVEGIGCGNLKTLQAEGIDTETITSLIKIRTEALAKLQYFAKHYNLPDKPAHTFRPLLRFLSANYLLWTLGYPESYLTQPLFFIYKGTKLYFLIMFLKAISMGIINIINHHIEEQRCHEASKIWSWIPIWQNYTCSYCGDLPIDVKYINDPYGCYTNYLERSRTLPELLSLFSRFNSSMILYLELDLSSQRIILKEKQLSVLLKFLASKPFETISFTLNGNQLSMEDIAAICAFVKNTSFLLGVPPDDANSCTFANSTFESGAIEELAKCLQDNNYINTLDLSSCNLKEEDIFILAKGLKKSAIVSLYLNDNPIGDKGLQAIAENWPSKLAGDLAFDSCNITSKGCIAAMSAWSSIASLSFQNNPVDSRCAEAISRILNKMESLSLGEGGQIDDVGIRALAQALSKENYPYFGYLTLTGYNVSIEALSALVATFPGLYNFEMFYYSDNRFDANFNYSIFLPRLFKALLSAGVDEFRWEGRNGFGWGDYEAELFARFLEQDQQGHRGLSILSLRNNNIGPKGMQAIALALSKSDITDLNFDNNKVGAGIIALAKHLPISPDSEYPNTYALSFDNNNLTTADITAFVDALNTSSLFCSLSFNGNLIGNTAALKFIKSIKFASDASLALCHTPRSLTLKDTHIDLDGALLIAEALIKRKHGLWVNSLNNKRSLAQAQPESYLNILDLSNNPIGNSGAQVLCNILPYTNIGNNQLLLDNTGANPSTIENCGIISSASSLRADIFSPYLLLFRNYQIIKKLFYTFLYQPNHHIKMLPSEKMINEFSVSSKLKSNTNYFSFYEFNLKEFQLPIHNFQTELVIINGANYNKTLIINLDKNIPIKSTFTFTTDIQAIIGSAQCNNFIIGNSHTLIVINQNQGNNLLISGKDNKLLLNGKNQNHIVIRTEQGTIKIMGFSQRDLLHIMDDQTIYSNSQFICRELNHQPNSLTLLQLRGTEVQFTNTNCEIISTQIRFNNQTAWEKAQTDVFQSYVNQNTLLYQSLFSMCETFLKSVSESALLSATPKFISEIYYRIGGFTRYEAEKLARQMQFELMVCLNDSPTAITASLLAGFLTSRLSSSPKIIAMVSMGGSIVTSVITTIWTQDISFAWVALQTGIAFMGASLGAVAVEKAEEATTGLIAWWNKRSDAKHYATSYFKFWSKEEIYNNNQNLEIHGQVIKPFKEFVNKR